MVLVNTKSCEYMPGTVSNIELCIFVVHNVASARYMQTQVVKIKAAQQRGLRQASRASLDHNIICIKNSDRTSGRGVM